MSCDHVKGRTHRSKLFGANGEDRGTMAVRRRPSEYKEFAPQFRNSPATVASVETPIGETTFLLRSMSLPRRLNGQTCFLLRLFLESQGMREVIV